MFFLELFSVLVLNWLIANVESPKSYPSNVHVLSSSVLDSFVYIEVLFSRLTRFKFSRFFNLFDLIYLTIHKINLCESLPSIIVAFCPFYTSFNHDGGIEVMPDPMLPTLTWLFLQSSNAILCFKVVNPFENDSCTYPPFSPDWNKKTQTWTFSTTIEAEKSICDSKLL